MIKIGSIIKLHYTNYIYIVRVKSICPNYQIGSNNDKYTADVLKTTSGVNRSRINAEFFLYNKVEELSRDEAIMEML